MRIMDRPEGWTWEDQPGRRRKVKPPGLGAWPV